MKSILKVDLLVTLRIPHFLREQQQQLEVQLPFPSRLCTLAESFPARIEKSDISHHAFQHAVPSRIAHPVPSKEKQPLK
jgi:hypothetical protein